MSRCVYAAGCQSDREKLAVRERQIDQLSAEVERLRERVERLREFEWLVKQDDPMCAADAAIKRWTAEHQAFVAENTRLREALRLTVDLCNAMREYAPTLNLNAERQLRDALALAAERMD